MDIPRVTHQFADVQGVRVFYRSAGPEDAPALLLLHGFPSASHQFRRLIDALGTRYRVIAPTTRASGTRRRHPASPTPSTGWPTSWTALPPTWGWTGS